MRVAGGDVPVPQPVARGIQRQGQTLLAGGQPFGELAGAAQHQRQQQAHDDRDDQQRRQEPAQEVASRRRGIPVQHAKRRPQRSRKHQDRWRTHGRIGRGAGGLPDNGIADLGRLAQLFEELPVDYAQDHQDARPYRGLELVGPRFRREAGRRRDMDAAVERDQPGGRNRLLRLRGHRLFEQRLQFRVGGEAGAVVANGIDDGLADPPIDFPAIRVQQEDRRRIVLAGQENAEVAVGVAGIEFDIQMGDRLVPPRIVLGEHGQSGFRLLQRVIDDPLRLCRRSSVLPPR